MNAVLPQVSDEQLMKICQSNPDWRVERDALRGHSPYAADRMRNGQSYCLCPDFVIEIRSLSDNSNALKDKMEEYIANGTEPGWLIDTKQQKVFNCRRNQSVERIKQPAQFGGGLIVA
ncbi:MAG: hypothetical protein NVSMB56_10020 [Pyrinomonadaceae bacterium]